MYVGEFNGDGKTDLILSPHEISSDTTWTIYLSKGDGSFETKKIGLMKKSYMQDIVIQDMDKDGQTDINFRCTRWDNTGFLQTFIIADAQVRSERTAGTFPNTGCKLISSDIHNGDRYNKLMALFGNGQVTMYGSERNTIKERLLSGVISSYGVITKVAYSPLEEYSLYKKGTDAVAPYLNYTGGIMAVSDVLSYYNNELHSHVKYEYKNAVVHTQGLGFRGFEEVSRQEQATGRKYQQTFAPYAYSTLIKEESDTHTSEYAYVHIIATNKIRKSRLTEIVTNDKLTGTKITHSYDYDTYGNLTEETVDYGDNTNKVITLNTYTNKTTTADYRLGLLTNQKTETSKNGGSTVSNETISYNSNYLPLTVTNTRGNYLLSTATFEYDSKSNLTGSKVKKYTSTKTLTETYTYDSWGRRITSTNPLKHTTKYTYNAKGLLEKETDHKGNVTTYAYDNWGRVIKVSLPDDTTTETSYKWGSNSPQTAVYYCHEVPLGKPEVQIYYDAFGRVLREGTKRFDGSFLYVDTEYDKQGKITRESLPFNSASPIQWDNYLYDDYDRVTMIKYASGRSESYSYNGLKETSVINGVTSTKTYDAAGFLIRSADVEGEVFYYYRSDGQLSYVESNNIKIAFTYDSYGRRTAINDPCAGQHKFTYDDAGNIIELTLPTGKINTMEYDDYNRLIKKKFTGDFSTDYTYDEDGNLKRIESSNGMEVRYGYNNLGRITIRNEIINNYSLVTMYGYKEGNLFNTHYYAGKVNSTPLIGTEKYKYTNGNLSGIYFNTAENTMKDIPLWEVQQEIRGMPQKVSANKLQRYYSYNTDNQYTELTYYALRRSVIHGYTYNTNGSLINRTDYKYEMEEKFEYDNLDRLIKTTSGTTGTTGKEYTISYDKYGNRTNHSGIGVYTYNGSSPYTLTNATCYASSPVIPDDDRETMYNSLNMPFVIFQGDYQALFEYKPNKDRGYMMLQKKTNGVIGTVFTRLYFDNNFEMDIENNVIQKQRLYLAGDYYSAPAVYVKENNTWNLYHIFRDHLGSITEIMDNTDDNNMVASYSYDPWGRLRNPKTHEIYPPGQEPELMLGRGYTGHEHLPWFGVINMNARLYDPVLGRFVAPDPYVQAPDFTQNFNRYSYCLNNPFRYTDTSGEAWFMPILIGAAMFATGNVTSHALKGDIKSFGDGLKYFAQGAITGGLLGATWQFSPYIPYVGKHIQTAMNAYGILQVGSTIAGFTFGALNDGGKGMENAAKTFLGNFYLDENSFFRGIWQGWSRHTWEFPQTAVGYGFTQARNIFGKVDRVDYFGGATFATQEYSSKNDGISIGNFININITNYIDKDFKEWVLSNPLYMHEYGHTIDSRLFGPTYLFAVGIPSIFSANNSHMTPNGLYSHKTFWTEIRANKKAAKYFKKHFGIEWNYTSYPLK